MESKDEESDVNEAFDEIFLFEDRAAQRGFKTGYVDGKETGEEEGLNLGFQKGFELGLELGRIRARAEAVLKAASVTTESRESSRASKAASDLIQLVDEVPNTGVDKIDLPKVLDRIRAKEKLLSAHAVGSTKGVTPQKKDLSF